MKMNIEEIPDYKLGETPANLPDENPKLYRLINAKRALRAGYEDVEDAEVCITDMLADLRHLCDACGIEFHVCDRMAFTHYTAEKHGEGKDNMEEEIQTRAEEECEKENDSKRRRSLRTLTKEDWIEIYYALDLKKFQPPTCDNLEWTDHLQEIMDEIGPDGCNYWPVRTCCAVVGASKHDPEDSRTYTPPLACDAEGNLIGPALSTWICPTCKAKFPSISFMRLDKYGIPYCSECNEDMHLFLDEE